jgi:hypothetical protein
MKKRKANRYARGNRYEVKYKKYLESLGYWVYKPTRTRFAHQKDIWNMWDLLCYHPKHKVICFIQLTTDKYIAKQRALEKLKDFDVKGISFEIHSPEGTYFKSGEVHLLKMISIPIELLEDTASEGDNTLKL